MPGGIHPLKYQLRAVEDLHAWLIEQGDWVHLGAADENKPAADGTVEAWGRDPANPVGGWYGLRKGYRGRFGMYLPPLLEALGLATDARQAEQQRPRRRLTRPSRLAAPSGQRLPEVRLEKFPYGPT